MSKICAKCDKPVYPLEELKCLDKIWHKGCFKCWECGMSLNMKNYKGFDRKPYCSAHYPQTKATVVADTPELQRLSQTSKLQSQTAYHDDFEKSKGKYTQIADDPELLRLVRNQEAVSMAKYHEEFEKKIKGSKIQVADDPETQRLKQLNSIVSQVEYKGLREKVLDMEARRQNVAQPDVPEKSSRRPTSGGPDDYANDGQKPSPYSDRSVSHSVTYCADGKVESQPQQRKIGSIADYDPMNFSSTLPHSALRQTQEWEETVVMSPSANHPSLPRSEPPSSMAGYQFTSLERPSVAKSGGSPNPGSRKPLTTVEPAVLYQGDSVTREERVLAPTLQTEDQQYMMQQQHQQQQQQLQQLRLQELQEKKLSLQQLLEQQQLADPEQFRRQQQQRQLKQQQQQYKVPYEQPVQHVVQRPSAVAGAVFQAMYDYEAQDDDEVSFAENDLVINTDPIDDGWMFGTIQRTGQRGMLPANYVERVQ